MATVVLLGTVDTKGAEYTFLADRLRSQGVGAGVVVVDCGVLGRPSFEADVTREEEATATGADARELALADVAAAHARLAAGDQFGKLVLETA